MVREVLLCILLFTGPLLAQEVKIEDGWKGVQVFKTTRFEIEKVFGKSETSSGSLAVYSVPEGKLNVTYSNGPCDKTSGSAGVYNVDENTVEEYRVNLLKPFPLLNLQWTKDRYELIRAKDTPEVYYYVDSENGLWVTVSRDNGVEMVSRLLFLGSKEMRKKLSCNRANQE